jgi:hypothetical protein
MDRTEVTIAELDQLLPLMLHEGPKRISIDIVGDAGIGKTTRAVGICEEQDILWVKVNCAAEITEPSDLLGLGKDVDGKTVFLPIFWVVEINRLAEETSKAIVVLIFDDWTRLQLQIFQAMMPVFLEYKVGSCYLHPKVRIIATSNPSESEKYNVRTMDLAQTERIQRIYIKYDEDCFFKYALANNFNAEWFAFLKQHTEMIYDAAEGKMGPISPRTAEFASQACNTLQEHKYNLEDRLAQLRLNAVIGEQVCATFMTNLRTQKHIIQPKAIIGGTYKEDDLKRILAPGAADLLGLTFSRLAAEIAKRDALKGKDLENVQKFMWANPSDELNYVFLKLLPEKKGLNVLDAKLLDRLKDRIQNLPS